MRFLGPGRGQDRDEAGHRSQALRRGADELVAPALSHLRDLLLAGKPSQTRDARPEANSACGRDRRAGRMPNGPPGPRSLRGLSRSLDAICERGHREVRPRSFPASVLGAAERESGPRRCLERRVGVSGARALCDVASLPLIWIVWSQGRYVCCSRPASSPMLACSRSCAQSSWPHSACGRCVRSSCASRGSGGLPCDTPSTFARASVCA